MNRETDDQAVLTLRLTGADAVRFWRIMDAAKQRNPYSGKSDVIRELLGLAPLQVLNEEDVIFFRTGEKKVSGRPLATSGQKIPLGNSQLPKKKTGT